MAEILDIVQKLVYQVEGGEEISTVSAEFTKQIKQLTSLIAENAKLQNQLKKTAEADVQGRAKINAQLLKNKQLIEQTNLAIQKEVTSNKALQQELVKEIGIINLLDARYKALIEDKKRASSVTEIKAINRELGQVQAQLNKLNGAGGGVFSQIQGGILQGLGIGAGLGIAGGVASIGSFITDAGRLAAEAEGVQRAFGKLNQPNLLDNLRSATKGTVSDLELMKNAIQFSNFGLPVEKLATALEFARRRAADTGVSVEYLVQSITTGIGRQSPLILDNLGINAKRVRDEFQKTGNFAEAAFKIIQEESAKAGQDLETFAQIQGRLNADIENQKVLIGEAFNSYKGFLIELARDAASPTNIFDGFAANYIENQKKIRQAKEDTNKINAQSDVLFLQNFETFTKQYTNADFQGREKIKEQAKSLYNTLSSSARDFYKNDADNLNIYLFGLQQSYQRAIKNFQTTPINLNTLTAGSIRGLSKEQLTSLQDQIELSSSGLTRNDTKQIARLRTLSEAIKKELDTISTTKTVTAKDALQSAKDRDAILADLIQRETDLNNQYALYLSQDLDSGLPLTIEQRQAREETYNKEQKRLNNLQAQRLVEIELSLTKSAAKTRELKLKQAELLKEAEGLKEVIPSLPFLGQQGAQRPEFTERGFTTPKATDPAERQKDNIDAIKSSYQSLVGVLQTLNSLYAQQQQLLDKQYQTQSDRVRDATVLAERGNAAELKAEQDKLDGIAKKREEVARQQVQINSVLQASNAALALTDALLVVTNAGKTGDPYTIAARIAAAVAALAAGFSLVAGLKGVSDSFAEGVVDYKGKGTGKSDSNVVRISNGESVITAAATQKYKPMLEAMNAGTLPMLNTTTVNTISTKKLEKKMDSMIGAIEDNRFKQNIFFDERGVGIMTERAMRKHMGRFR